MMSNIRIIIVTAMTLFLVTSVICADNSSSIGPGTLKCICQAQDAMEKEDFTRAQTILENLIKKNPGRNNYLVEFTLANAYSCEGSDDRAVGHYRRSADMNPDYVPTWNNLGRACFNLEKYDEAARAFLRAYDLSEKSDAQTLYQAAVSYVMAGKSEQALEHLEYLASGRAGPPQPQWLEALVKVYMDQERYGNAIKILETILDSDALNPRWWQYLAYCHMQNNDRMKALAALSIRAYLVDPDKEDLVTLGDLSLASGIPLQAAGYYERITAADPEACYYEKLARALIEGHRKGEAMEAIDHGIEQHAGSARLWRIKGRLLYEDETFEEAYTAFGRSADATESDEKGGDLLMMGYCALSMEKMTLAREMFTKAAEFPRQHKDAAEMIRRIDQWMSASK